MSAVKFDAVKTRSFAAYRCIDEGLNETVNLVFEKGPCGFFSPLVAHVAGRNRLLTGHGTRGSKSAMENLHKADGAA